MRRLHPLALALTLALGCATAAAPAPSPDRSAPGDPAAVLGPPPPRGSAADREDLAVVLWEQRVRTEADVARLRHDPGLGLDFFAPALGERFDAAAHPRTRALIDRVHARATPVILSAKERFGRIRPYDSDARVEPVAEKESTPSYPSGHATRGVLVARVLAELAPARRDALRQAGLRPGYDRVLGGVHYPSDVLAGFRLGDAIADAFLADPALQESLETVRREEWGGAP
ncbi:MAG TPA: phosphatase PAP2 family protein [Anaeromyxobacteraceae bacterium]|nr:phosphatase PAP2 family protein [Anaeromyxobacteraceae bacterium]